MKKQLLYLGAPALLLVAASSAPAALQLQYTFDEPTGQALDTGAPAPANGDLLGGATRSANTPSGLGSAVDFVDAPYAHVLSTDAAKLDGLNQLTVSTWLNLRTFPGASSSAARLVAKQAAGTFGGASRRAGCPTSPSRRRSRRWPSPALGSSPAAVAKRNAPHNQQ